MNPLLPRLAAYLQEKANAQREAAVRSGKPVYDFGIGDPREPTPGFIRAALRDAVPEVSQYPSISGTPAFRKAVAAYLSRRFALSLDPDREILPCAGAKEALFHLPLCAASPDRPLCWYPDPAYPVYERAILFAGATPRTYPLRAERGFLPDLDSIPAADLRSHLWFRLLSAQSHRRGRAPVPPREARAPFEGARLPRRLRRAVRRPLRARGAALGLEISRKTDRHPLPLEAQRHDRVPQRLHRRRPGDYPLAAGGEGELRRRLAGVRAAGRDRRLERRRARRRAEEGVRRQAGRLLATCASSGSRSAARAPSTSGAGAGRRDQRELCRTPGGGQHPGGARDLVRGRGEGLIRLAMVPTLADCRAATDAWPRG